MKKYFVDFSHVTEIPLLKSETVLGTVQPGKRPLKRYLTELLVWR